MNNNIANISSFMAISGIQCYVNNTTGTTAFDEEKLRQYDQVLLDYYKNADGLTDRDGDVLKACLYGDNASYNYISQRIAKKIKYARTQSERSTLTKLQNTLDNRMIIFDRHRDAWDISPDVAKKAVLPRRFRDPNNEPFMNRMDAIKLVRPFFQRLYAIQCNNSNENQYYWLLRLDKEIANKFKESSSAIIGSVPLRSDTVFGRPATGTVDKLINDNINVVGSKKADKHKDALLNLYGLALGIGYDNLKSSDSCRNQLSDVLYERSGHTGKEDALRVIGRQFVRGNGGVIDLRALASKVKDKSIKKLLKQTAKQWDEITEDAHKVRLNGLGELNDVGNGIATMISRYAIMKGTNSLEPLYRELYGRLQGEDDFAKRDMLDAIRARTEDILEAEENDKETNGYYNWEDKGTLPYGKAYMEGMERALPSGMKKAWRGFIKGLNPVEKKPSRIMKALRSIVKKSKKVFPLIATNPYNISNLIK